MIRAAVAAVAVGLMLAAAPVAAPVAAQVLEAHIDGRIEPLEVVADDSRLATEGPVWWRGVVTRFGAGFVRLRLRASSDGPLPPLIVGVEGDRGGRFSYLWTDIPPEGLWTGLMPSGTAVVTLIGAEQPAGLRLTIDAVLTEADTGTLFSTWGGVDETLPVNDPAVPAAIRDLSGPVARLSFVRGGLPRSCTGFLIGADRLVTNEHCVADAESCASMVALFGYEYDAQNRLSFGHQVRCAAVVGSDFDLDVALIRLAAEAGPSFGTLAIAGADAVAQAPLVVIQHPGGAPKQVSFINCGVLASPVDGRAAATDLTHSCDTAEGSSGAPMLDGQGRLVALHHYGFASGQVGDWDDNRAVRALRLRDWLAATDPDPDPEPAAEPEPDAGGAPP